jgi:hypothetical protein
VVPALLAALESPDGLLRQVAAYGLGVCSAAGGPWRGPAAGKLEQALQLPDAGAPDMAFATENVVSALGKFALALEDARLLGAWLDRLPLEHDEQEAQENHALLCSLAEQGRVGAGQAAQAVRVLALCLKPVHKPQVRQEEDGAEEAEEEEEGFCLVAEAARPDVVRALGVLAQSMGKVQFDASVASVRDAEARALLVQQL